MCAPIKLNFPFCKRKPLFDALLNVYQTDVKTKNDPQFVISSADRALIPILHSVRFESSLTFTTNLSFYSAVKTFCSDVDYNEV